MFQWLMAKYYDKFMCVAIILFLASPVCSIASPSSNSLSQTLPAKSSSHFVTVNGVRLHYIEAGSGPLIILLHGWPETSYSWRNTMAVLSKNYHVVAPDLRGLGQSEHTQSGYDKKTIATDIKGLVEYLGEKQAIIIGHDMGGKAAYVMAHLYPQMVTKLVLVDCFIPSTEKADALHGGSWHYGFHMAKDFPEMLTKGREKEYISAMIKLMSYKKDAISEETIDEYVKYYSTPGGMTAGFNYYRALKEDAALVETFKGEKLTMPVLAITGAHSAGEKLSKALTGEAPLLQSVIVKDSGHFVAEEQPEIFQQTVLSFLSNKSQYSSHLNTETELKKLEKENHGVLGVYALDANSNQSISYHAEKRFPFCSTFKLMLVATILKQSETHSDLLQEKLVYTKKDIDASGYTPITEKYINQGMTVSKLCAAAIMYSDNGAANLLIKRLGGVNQVNAFAQSIGDHSFRLDRFEPELNTAIPGDLRDTTTPYAMAHDLQKLLLSNTLMPMQRNLLQSWLLHNTTGNLRIRAAISKDWSVADKTGTGDYSTTNDIAIMWPPNKKPIIVAIYFTQYQKDAQANNTVIKKATEIVLNKFSENSQDKKII